MHVNRGSRYLELQEQHFLNIIIRIFRKKKAIELHKGILSAQGGGNKELSNSACLVSRLLRYHKLRIS